MILEIDIGNTCIKWRCREGEKILQEKIVGHGGIFDYAKIFDSVSVAPQTVFLVTVISKEQQRLTDWSLATWAVKPCVAEVAATASGVKNAYQDLSQMGADRWVAMVSAYSQLRQACMVVDCGSACTVDLLLADGVHLGGYIVPGLRLMKDALFRDTDRVKLLEIDYDDTINAGKSTAHAVAAGSQLMLIGLITLAFDELCAAGNGKEQPTMVLTGGMSTRLYSWLRSRMTGMKSDVDIRIMPNLVFDGLPLVCGKPSTG